MTALLAAIAPLLSPIDVLAFAASLPAKIEKDELRMRLFGVAVVNKTAEIALKAAANAAAPAEGLGTGASVTVTQPHLATIVYEGTPVVADLAHVEAFGKELADILGDYVHEAGGLAPKKWSLKSVFGHSDPFAPGRAEVRAFARRWALDPAFVEAMG